MIAVAVVGLLMAAGSEAKRLIRLAEVYRLRAGHHEAFRDLCLAEASDYRYAYDRHVPNAYRHGGDPPGAEARERTLARYRDAMAAKYRRAARYPWFPVEPNPPEPN
jgi:hypothetical protein